jgi:hypothetical protein
MVIQMTRGQDLRARPVRQPAQRHMEVTHMTKGPREGGCALIFCELVGFLPYIMIFEPVLGDLVHFWRILGPF